MKPISHLEAMEIYGKYHSPFSFYSYMVSEFNRVTIFGAFGNMHLAENVEVNLNYHRLESRTIDFVD